VGLAQGIDVPADAFAQPEGGRNPRALAHDRGPQGTIVDWAARRGGSPATAVPSMVKGHRVRCRRGAFPPLAGLRPIVCCARVRARRGGMLENPGPEPGDLTRGSATVTCSRG